MSENESRYSENWRQVEHLTPIAFAFLLRYLSWTQALIPAFLAILYALFSPRFLVKTQRPDEASKHFSPGKLSYAVAVFLMILLFREEKYIVGAVWANLAVGDAVSNLIGRNFGRLSLPWNPRKTWLGLWGSFLMSSLTAFLLILWIGLPSGASASWIKALALASTASIVCSFTETVELPTNDNITICIVGSAFLFWLTRAQWPMAGNPADWGVGLALSVSCGLLAFLLRTVTVTGLALGIVFGAIVFFAFGARGFVVLGTFFLLGSGFSKIGYRKKSSAGIAQADQGRRSAGQVWGKGFAPVIAAIASIFLSHSELIVLAFVSAVATALYDTTATELGQLWGKRTLLLPSFERVPPGTRGGVSLEGSLLGLLAAGTISLEAFLLRMVGLWGVAWSLVSAVVAVHLEGYLVALGNSRAPVSSQVMNAFHTTLAMLIALLLGRIRL